MNYSLEGIATVELCGIGVTTRRNTVAGRGSLRMFLAIRRVSRSGFALL